MDDRDPRPRRVHNGNWNLDLPTVAGRQYLATRDPSVGPLLVSLWATDGTSPGTRQLRENGFWEYSTPLGLADGRLLWWFGPDSFSDLGPEELELWLTDGTVVGTRKLSFPGLKTPLGAKPRELVALDSRAAFILDDPRGDDDPNDQVFPERLFASDGTAVGTFDLVSFPPELPVPVRRLTLVTPIPGGRVLFHVDDQLFEHSDLGGIWVADGRTGGTLKVATPGRLAPVPDPVDFWPTSDGALVASRFFAEDSAPAGLFRLFADGRAPLELVGDGLAFGNRFFFVGPSLHLLSQGGLFRTDGTPGGTSPVADSGISWSVPFQGGLLFDRGGQLWSYDGQAPPRPANLDLDPLRDREAVDSGAGIFGTDRFKLWYFDGVRTAEVATFRQILRWAPFHGGLAFVAEATFRDAELWFTDGTTTGTRRIADLWPGQLGSYPDDLTVVGDCLFFTAHDGTHGRELWSTDATAAETVMYDLNPGVGSSVPTVLTVAGQTLFFSAYDDDRGRELWSLDLGDSFSPPPPSGGWLASPALPGFRFQVRIAESTVGRLEPACLPETACLSGAVAGRPEIFLRVVGPRGNGFLWPTLVKFTTSEVEIWLEQTATGVVKYYSLAGARPGIDELPARFDRLGFRPESATGPAIVAVPPPTAAPEPSPLPAAGPPPPAGTTFFDSPALPGFRVAVRITAGDNVPPVRRENACIAETLCLSGAVQGRSEVFVRIVGPKPNGFLWPTLARFTSSQVEVWIEQKATGLRQYYLLPGASADSDDLTGLFDREGFEP